MKGILLIGMPGSGKSDVGRKVAEKLGFAFFDGDTEIEKKYPDRQRFLDTYGDDAYIQMEGEVVANLPLEDSVLAPGGSIIYSEKAKNYLSKCFKVFLDISLDKVKERLADKIDARGIVRLKKLGLDKLYSERKPLFKAYADSVINRDDKDRESSAEEIVNAYCMHQLTRQKVPVKYVSTNGGSTASFTEALLQGLAPDKGLFVPESIPCFTGEEIRLMGHIDYTQLAFIMMRQFVDIEDNALREMCKQAYDFGLPIEKHGSLFIARFDQGPSASFKDFAGQLLARMMDYVAEKRDKKLIILTATSGDTGGAVAAAFSKVRAAKTIILMPAYEITERQRRQMTTVANAAAVLVKGKFDDCQALAKKAFAEIPGLSSANSINIGRLLPQIVYYFYIYSRTGAGVMCVPSGNFGNLVAGLIAKRMGLPVKFIAAVNENDEFPRFLESGKYVAVAPSRRCLSNAMNVGNPSNLARLIWLYGGKMDDKGKILVMPDMEKLREDVASVSITDKETTEAIREAYKKGIVLEPHGAVGFAAIEKLNKPGVTVLFETAHPAKFPEELDALGISYPTHVALARLDRLKEHYVEIMPNMMELKKVIDGVTKTFK
ncbi:MAG: threonine synthase [Candidatus Woesearchaeota archaeon]